MKNLVVKLIKLADELDKEGYSKEAEEIDEIAENMANETNINNNNNFKLENWTPHPVTLILENDEQIVLRPEVSTPPRVISKDEGSITGPYGMPIILKKASGGNEVIGLPDPKPGVFLLVSTMVAQAASDRDDLLAPSGFVRDESGNILGCKSFIKYV